MLENLKERILLVFQSIPWPLRVFYLFAFLGLFTLLSLYDVLSTLLHYGHFFFLGLVGALVANSTGAGGGVVFIPFFSELGFTGAESVGTSMAIQCFGMTAGAIGWWYWLKASCEPSCIASGHQKKVVKETSLPTLNTVKKIIANTAIPAVAGIIIAQWLLPLPSIDMSVLFRVFSVFFGGVLLITTILQRSKKKQYLTEWQPRKAFFLWVTGFLGGIITAWLSVGVGELIALLLFFLRFNPLFAVAVGVIVSSASVLIGISFHIVEATINLPVVIFAAQAALIGGYLARFITQKLGAFWLKIGFSLWILGSGLVA